MTDASTAVGSVGHAPGLQQRIKRIGLVAGPLLALLVYFALPVEYRAADGTTAPLTHAGRATLAMMAWMATWWMTEAVEIEVTSLLPIALFPILGVMPLGKTTANYGSDVIYLFLGGFVIALAIARCGLDRRIAFFTLRLVGTRPKAIVAGTMGATAFLSMWVSNTATAAMMIPIVLSVIDVTLRRRTGKGLASTAAYPTTTATCATSRCRRYSASPTRHRSADWEPSSAHPRTASWCASSSRPPESRSAL